MKRIVLFALAIVMALSSPALAINRVQWPTNIQPPSNWINTMGKNEELGLGQLVWDMLGRSNSGMIYTNLTLSPQSGLYVQVGPSVANTMGSLYASYAADLVPYGTGAGQIPADGTLTFHQGFLMSNGPAIGPLTPTTTAGQSTAFTIECQTQTVDQTQQTVNFVSPTNIASSAAALRDRADIIACQATMGVSAVSPAAPAVDLGWLKVGVITIPANAVTITAAMTVQGTPFNGFLPAGSATQFVDTTSTQSVSGNKTFNGVTTFNSAFNFSNGSVVLGALPAIAGDYQALPGLIVNTATGSNGIQFMANGTLNGAAVTPAGVFKTANTSLAPTLLTVNGATFDGNSLNNISGNLVLNGKTTGNVSLNYGGGSGGARVYDGGTANYAQLLATGLTFSAVSTSSYTSAGATVYGALNLPSQAAGQCATFDASHNLVGAGGACGLTSGTVTSVVGSGNVTATTTSGAVTVGLVASPTFTTASVGSAATIGALGLGTDGLLTVNRSGGTVTFTGTGGVVPLVVAAGGFQTGSSQFFPTYISENGPITGTVLNGSGAGLTAATVPNAALVTTPVTSVAGTGNIASSGGVTPSISFTGILPVASGGTGSAAQTFTDLTTAQTVAGNKTFSSAGTGFTFNGLPTTGGTPTAGLTWNCTNGGGEACITTGYNGPGAAAFYHYNGTALVKSAQIDADGTYTNASNAPIPPVYDQFGNGANKNFHMVCGFATAGSGTVGVTLSGKAVFTTNQSYTLNILDVSSGSIITNTIGLSGTSFTFGAVSGRSYNYCATGY